MNILVIEDNRQEMALLRETLSDLTGGTIRLEHAERLSAACAYLAAGRFDAILLDLNLPDSRGLDTFTRMRAKAPEVPIVILTGLDDERLAMEGLRAGAQDYLVKGQSGGDMISHSLRYAIERKRLVTGLEVRVAERTAELEAANQALHRDISERKRAEKERTENALLLTFMLNTGPSCIKRVAPDGTLLQMNPAGLRLIEACGEQDALGLSVFDLVVPEHRDAFVRMHHDVIDGHNRTLQFEIQGLKGGRRWMETYAVPFRNPVIGGTEHLAVTNDITERKRMDVALRDSEERFRQLAEHINEVFWTSDPTKEEILYISPAYEQIWGRSCASLYAAPQSWMESIAPEDRARVRDAAVTTQTTGTYDEEYRIVRPDGATRWIHDRAFPIRDAAGAAYRIVGIAEDITERKQAEEVLQRAKFTIERATEAIYLISSQADILDNNEAACTMLGYSKAEFMTMKVFDINPNFSAEMWPNFWEETKQRGAVLIEAHHRTKDGRIIPVEVNVNYLRYDGYEYHCAFVRDITERQRAEQAVRESVARFQIVARATNDVVRDWDLRTNEVWWNGYETQFGWQLGELGVGAASWYNGLHLDDYEHVVDGIRRVIDQGGTDWSDSYRFRRRDGRFAVIFDRGVVIRDEKGLAIRMVGAMQDVTERKHLEEQLLHAQKMEGIGRLASGVAHDFNNLLTVISGYADLLLTHGGLENQPRLATEEIKKAAERAATLTQQLLTFSRQQAVQLKDLDLSQLVAKMAVMLRRLLGEDIHLVTVLAPAGCRIAADPGQLEQVVMNLAVNARDAMAEGGTLTIETALVTWIEPNTTAQHTGHAGPSVQLTVRDTGDGIAPEVLPHIFEPFFTTKEVGKGTGLGLATTYGIVIKSGGTIEVKSSPGQGATFVMYFPQCTGGDPAGQPAPQPAAAMGGTETILLVEDEASVRGLLRTLLTRRGYRVLEAGNSQEALAQLQTHQGNLQLVLTDVVIPGLRGYHLAEQIQAAYPKVKLLFMSGYEGSDVLRDHKQLSDRVCIKKPFSPNELLRAVRAVLDAGEVH